MTEKELMGLISRSVEDAFAANKEIIAAGLVVIGNNSSRDSAESRFKLEKFLLGYMTDVSEIICLAVSKMLFDAGIMEICREKK